MDEKCLFEARKIVKTFDGTQALKGVDLAVNEGEVVGLVGENGAGKSTLLKIIIGFQNCDSGDMVINGKPYHPSTPLEANHNGVGMVYQEQSLIPSLTVGQNIFYGHEAPFKLCGLIRWKKMYQQVSALFATMGIEGISPRQKISELTFVKRQMIEIAKVVNITRITDNARCLILLDEPTSVLNEKEVEALFSQIRALKQAGHSVVFVSHHLDEVIEICDRIYVYRDGANAGVVKTGELPAKQIEKQLYRMMVGKSTSDEYYHIDQQSQPKEQVVLEVKDLGRKGVFKHVSFALKKGEILGICGVEGSGKEELCDVLCGDTPADFGEIYIDGKKVRLTSPAKAKQMGILHIPKERLMEGIILGLDIGQNIILSSRNAKRYGRLISKKKVDRISQEWIEKLNIKAGGPNELLMQLSGGNQQKVVFSRALESECKIMILNHPTRGVDVGAKAEIYALVRKIVEQGRSVILLGDTLDEVIFMSNRICILHDGLVTKEFEAPPDAKPSKLDIIEYMM